MAELTVEQKRALAMAAARLRMQQSNEPLEPIETPAFEREAAETLAERPLSYSLARQTGLAGRHGLEAFGGGAIANKLGLPQPENARERVVGDVTRAMAGTGAMGALASKVAPIAQGIPQKLAAMLAESPMMQQFSAIGSGASGGITRESGGTPAEQFTASVAGGMVPGVAALAARPLVSSASNFADTVAASFGHKPAIERIAQHATQKVAGESRPQIMSALGRSTEYAPGVNPTAAEAIAEAQIGKPEQFGGATIKLQKDLSGAQGIEDILPSAVRAQNVAMGQHIKNVKAIGKMERAAAMQGVNTGRGLVDSNDIVTNLETSLSRPEVQASDLMSKTLGAVKAKLQSLGGATGDINVRALYTVRKDLGKTINQFAKETANWDKKAAAGIEIEAQRYIDDAIEAAGGVGWRDYLKNYAMGLRAPENQVARAREAKLIGAGVKSSHAQNLAAGEIPKPPTLLSRPMMAVNWALNLLSRDANTPVAKRVAEAMRDPDEYLKLLQAPATDPARVLLERTRRQAVLATGAQYPTGILAREQE